MSGETVFIICLLGFGAYGILKYSKSEETDQAKILKVVKDIRSDITGLSRRIKTLELNEGSIQVELRSYKALIESMSKEVDEAQDHLAKVRGAALDLEKKTIPQVMELSFKPVGPIPVEIHTPVQKKKVVSRKTVNKTKTGYRTRLETRTSPLKGDPDAPPRKPKSVMFKKIKKQIKALEN